jgi:guanylate kinase
MRDKSKIANPTSDPLSKPLLIVLSGPSGVGKDTVLNHIKNFSTNLKFVTTITTRPQRPNEKDNVDYHFVSREEFQKLLKNNELLESANVYGNWYGVPKEPVRKALKQGNDIMVKVDVQGAASIKNITPQAVFIFLMPPSMEELANRLRQRYTESPDTLVVRLHAAVEEIRQVPLFDYVVVNHSNRTESAAAEIQAIITAEKCRIKPREIELL